MSQDVEKIETSVERSLEGTIESVEGISVPIDQSAAPPSLLDELDAKIEAASRPPMSEILVSSEVAGKLAMGFPVSQVAKEAGVSVATVRRWMRTAAMQDLIGIETRRLIRHMSRRDLGKEKYLALATALNMLTEREQRLRNADLGNEDRAISVTQIEQINILVRGREREATGIQQGGGTQGITAGEIPEITGAIIEDGEE
jgi:hypothetical protein